MSSIQFVSTTIPYVNSRPHVGFALELVQADAYVRYLRLKGRSVYFQTGTDENSIKNVIAANQRNVSVQSHVDEHAQDFRELAQNLNISYDSFVRTTAPLHHTTVQDFWTRLDREDLYRKSYGGLYCAGCEDYFKESDLEHGLCPDHGTQPEWVEEENVFFRLSKYQQTLIDLIRDERIKITPRSKKKEILNFISRGLQDISVSRSRNRTRGWGIAVPGSEDQIIYVWIDALINYHSGLNEVGSGQWNELGRRSHFVGKNVWKFHAVYWPALLISAGYELPDEIIIHGFLTLNGKKISKSLGNVVDPLDLIRLSSSDTLRFNLLKGFSPFEDGDFSEGALKDVHHTYLVNGLGNLVGRLISLAARAGVDTRQLAAQASSLRLRELAAFDQATEQFQFDEAIGALWKQIDRINAEISLERPWERIKTDGQACHERIADWVRDLIGISGYLEIVLPTAGALITQRLQGSTREPSKHLFERIQ